MRKPTIKLRKTLADNVRAYRERHDLSQEALAEQCGLHRTYIGQVERLERNPRLSTLEIIAKSIGLTVPELLTPG